MYATTTNTLESYIWWKVTFVPIEIVPKEEMQYMKIVEKTRYKIENWANIFRMGEPQVLLDR